MNDINDINKIIYFSLKSHDLKQNQIINFLLCCKKNKLLKKIPNDIIYLIINNIKRNSWNETKNIFYK